MRSALLRGGFALATGTLGRLSWSSAQRRGRNLGDLFWYLGPKDRKRAHEHLGIAFPELEADARLRLARSCFRHLGTSLAELLHLRARPPAEAGKKVEVVGFETIEHIRTTGQPILVLTGHCGNWELISAANGTHGLGLAAMARRNDDPLLDQQIVALRGHLGTDTIARGASHSSRKLLSTLRRGGALAMLIDQDIRTDGVWVPFFGRLAHTPLAAAHLALRLGAAVVPTFAERLETGSHRVTFHPPLDLSSDATEATAEMTLAIEQQIRRRPEQWVWMHRRWRRRPPEESPDAPSSAS